MNIRTMHALWKSHILLPVLFGTVSTLINYSYGFGIRGVHLSQLPIIYRILDSEYLVNDFYVNEATSSIARLGYAYFIAFITTITGNTDHIQVIYFSLTLLSNIVVAVVTYQFAKDLFKNSILSGLIAAALVMSASTFSLGYTAEIYTSTLIPRTLARPLIFVAVYCAIMKKRLNLSMLFFGLASLIQPLYGLLSGGIVLLTHYIVAIFTKVIVSGEIKKQLFLASLIYASFFIISVLPQISQETLETEVFINILAYFRAPHHYIPSSFSCLEYVVAFSFFIAAGISYAHWKKIISNSKNDILISISAIIILIFLLCLGGFLFVELLPTRIWATAQTFRMLILLKWFGLIFIGGVIAESIEKNKVLDATYSLLSLFNPFLVGFAYLLQLVKDSLKKVFPEFNLFYITYTSLFGFLLVVIIYMYFPILYWLPIWLFYIIIFSFGYFHKRILSYFLIIGITMVSLNLLGVGISVDQRMNSEISTRSKKQNVQLDMYHQEFGQQGGQVANYARINTTKESIFLTPPYFGKFRIDAERAIVVDFQSIPFSDDGIIGWYTRIIDCYGETEYSGFASLEEMNSNYRDMNDPKLAELIDKYYITHAVLFIDTSTNYPIIFKNDVFKIIELY